MACESVVVSLEIGLFNVARNVDRAPVSVGSRRRVPPPGAWRSLEKPGFCLGFLQVKEKRKRGP